MYSCTPNSHSPSSQRLANFSRIHPVPFTPTTITVAKLIYHPHSFSIPAAAVTYTYRRRRTSLYAMVTWKSVYIYIYSYTRRADVFSALITRRGNFRAEREGYPGEIYRVKVTSSSGRVVTVVVSHCNARASPRPGLSVFGGDFLALSYGYEARADETDELRWIYSERGES